MKLIFVSLEKESTTADPANTHNVTTFYDWNNPNGAHIALVNYLYLGPGQGLIVASYNNEFHYCKDHPLFVFGTPTAECKKV